MAARGPEPRRRRQDAAQRGACATAVSDLWKELRGDRGRRNDHFVSDAGVLTSTPLQMMLVFNMPFSVAWGCVWIALYVFKYRRWKADLLSSYLNQLMFYIWAVIEPLRLYLGYTGNMSEKAASLAAFFLLSLFPQLFAHVLLLASPTLVLPFEVAAGSIMIVMLVVEAVVARRVTTVLIRKATAEFQLQQDDELLDETR